MKRIINDLVRKDVFTTGETAFILNVTSRTIAKMTDRKHNQLPSYRIGNGLDRRIPRDELIAFMKANHIPLIRFEDPLMPRVLCVCTNAGIAKELSCCNFLVRSAGNVLNAGIELQAFWPALVVLDYDFCPEADAVCAQVQAYPINPIVIGIGMDLNIPHKYSNSFVNKNVIPDGLLQVDVDRLLSKRHEKKGKK